LAYEECCGPVHDGQPAVTAEALMRSRYSAYALDNVDYLLRTWHPGTRPAALAPDPDLRWRGLEIVETGGGGMFDDTGIVEFRARYRAGDERGEMHERSRFVRHDGAWVYQGAD
jgi:SEC-C motif-containing protein